MEIIKTLLVLFLFTTLFICFTYGNGDEAVISHDDTVESNDGTAEVKKEEKRKTALLEWEDSNKSVLYYTDNMKIPDQYDLFFDRIVAITLFEANPDDGSPHKNIAIGVLLDDSRILTSFNPFRQMLKERNKMKKIKFTFMSSRKWYGPGGPQHFDYYGTYTRDISCARCVIPMEDRQILFEQWTDADQKHSPLHDLFILRTKHPARLGQLGNQSIGYDEKNRTTYIEETGPILTKFADSDTYIGKELKLVSLGLTNYEPMSLYQTLIFAIFDQSDLIDCNFWLPKNWGYFICFKNDPSFIGFGSSAMLFSNEILFGIGSFTIWRGVISVLVFTDVRPYADLISNTCTEEDLEVLYKIHG